MTLPDRSTRGLSREAVQFDGNECGWEALDYKVIVKKDKVMQKTEGGIIVPEDAARQERWTVTQGVLVSIGHLAFTERRDLDGTLVHWDNKPEVGDRVMFSKYSGNEFIGNDGDEYVIFTDKDIMGVSQ